MRSLDVGGNQIADLFGIFSKRSRVDDGIRRVRIDIGIGKEIPMYANGARFFRSNAAKVFRVFQFAIPAKRHGMGKDGGSHQSHGHATLKIRGKQKRKLRIALHTIQQLGSFVGLTTQQIRPIDMHCHREGADVILLYRFLQLQILRILLVEKTGAAPDHEYLAHLLFQGQLVEGLLRPFFAIAGEMYRSWMLIFIFRGGRRSQQESEYQ